jgi:hypothetical protein
MGILDNLFGKKKKRDVYAEKEEKKTVKDTVTENKEETPNELKSASMGYKEAVKAIKELKTPGDVKSFTKGDDRKTVVKAVKSRIKALEAPDKPKKEKKRTPGR